MTLAFKQTMSPTKAARAARPAFSRQAPPSSSPHPPPLPDYDSRADRNTTNLWHCEPNGPIATQAPIPGSHYRVKQGDTLFGVVSKAFGVESGKQRLALAQVINEDPCNLKYHTRSLSPGDAKLFFGSRISFSPRFADSMDEQLASSNGGEGHSYPVIRIPPETWGPGQDEETGASVRPVDHELVDESCAAWQSPDRNDTCDVTATLESHWSDAARFVSQALAEVPRPDTARTRLNENSLAALRAYFNLTPDDFVDKHDLIVEIRSKFAAINALFQGGPVHFECGTLAGRSQDPCSPDDLASAHHRMVEICPRGLDAMLKGDADFTWTLVHEVAHLVTAARHGERYHREWGTAQLTAEQASMNPDSYAWFTRIVRSGKPKRHPKPKCG